jgi:hypothetical protein
LKFKYILFWRTKLVLLFSLLSLWNYFYLLDALYFIQDVWYFYTNIKWYKTCLTFCFSSSFEPRHDKTNIVGLRTAWIHSSLRLLTVWSGSMLFAISFPTCNRVCKRRAWILIRLRGCAGWSGSMLVAKPLLWFCHDAAHLFKKRTLHGFFVRDRTLDSWLLIILMVLNEREMYAYGVNFPILGVISVHLHEEMNQNYKAHSLDNWHV